MRPPQTVHTIHHEKALANHLSQVLFGQVILCWACPPHAVLLQVLQGADLLVLPSHCLKLHTSDLQVKGLPGRPYSWGQPVYRASEAAGCNSCSTTQTSQNEPARRGVFVATDLVHPVPSWAQWAVAQGRSVTRAFCTYVWNVRSRCYLALSSQCQNP